MVEQIAVEVKNVRVSYRSYKDRPTSLKEALIKFVKTGQLKYHSTFDALSNLTFSIKKGSVFGILGSNGAGKSTLLKTIAGVLPATEGEIKTFGTLDSLIQLGAGFDPELNAIENIFLYGSLRRRSIAELKKKVGSILEFAELNEFAKTPIKYYSSGMYARLGFAVAIDSDPDILIVDEVLAVGDQRFRQKCEKVFEDRLKSGKTIVMVSHDLSSVKKLCTEVLLLSKGKIVYQGNAEKALEMYASPDYKTRLG